MPLIRYGEREFALQTKESVLDCLLRNGIAVSHSCRAGACQSCLVRGAGGPIPAGAQTGLKDTLRAQGYLLACSCRPEESLTILPAGDDQRVPARIARIEKLSESVARVALQVGGAFAYRAGQFVTLFREDGLSRSYSLASLPHEDGLELQSEVARCQGPSRTFSRTGETHHGAR